MLRKILGGAAVAAAAGAIIAGGATPASAGETKYNPDDFGGVNVLSNICAVNWNGNLGDVLTLDSTDTHDTCNGWDQNPKGVNVGSNLCAGNWDWQGAIVSGGHISQDDLYTLCNWSAE